jgi:hypothetical protein
VGVGLSLLVVGLLLVTASGAAIGIALIGSVLPSVFRDPLEPALALLPPEAAGVAGDNIGTAIAEANRAGSVELTTAARTAYVDSAHMGLRVALSWVFVALIGVLWRLGADA